MSLHFVAANSVRRPHWHWHWHWILLLGCVACSSRIPAPLATALSDGSPYTLYSLEPTPIRGAAGSGFHGYPILGSTPVKPADQGRLLTALKKGVAANDGVVAACFTPRHGIQTRHDGHTYDFVICFECYQVKVYRDGASIEGFATTELPQPQFDRTLRAAKVPLPKAATGAPPTGSGLRIAVPQRESDQ